VYGNRLGANLNAFASSRDRDPLTFAELRCSMFEVHLLGSRRWHWLRRRRRGGSELIQRSRVE
jgi:hypothetical protein